jgi:hypothetical protein
VTVTTAGGRWRHTAKSARARFREDALKLATDSDPQCASGSALAQQRNPAQRTLMSAGLLMPKFTDQGGAGLRREERHEKGYDQKTCGRGRIPGAVASPQTLAECCAAGRVVLSAAGEAL